MRVAAITILILLSVILHAQKHIVLISIDGWCSDRQQNGRFSLPNLHYITKIGVTANYMVSTFPSYTYPSHTAMLTGANPIHSGIAYNVPRGSNGEWNWFADAVKTSTLWQSIQQAGMTSAAIEWPVSVERGNERFITYSIPEIWDTKIPHDRITETRKYATPGLIEEIELNATGKLTPLNMDESSFSLDENAGRMAAYIFRTYKPNLLCVHFAGVDGAEHAQGVNGDSVYMALSTADRAIGNIMEAVQQSGVKDSTTIIVVGDHGFSDIHTAIRINSILQDVPARFYSAGGSTFLYRQPTTSGSDVVVAQTVKERLKTLPDSVRTRFRIVDRKELDRMGADKEALMALATVPGTIFSNAEKGSLTAKVKGGHHGYDPNLPEMHTGFIAAGAGIRKGAVIDHLSVTDIAPLIAKLLRIEFHAPDGKLGDGILENNN